MTKRESEKMKEDLVNKLSKIRKDDPNGDIYKEYTRLFIFANVHYPDVKVSDAYKMIDSILVKQ